MAAFTPSGRPSGEGGFTYLGVLFLIMLMGMGLASAGELWSTASRRDRERQLLWVGTQYAQALRSYYRASPGLAQYPKALEDLLQDERFPTAKHHIRQLYPDPIGGAEWSLQRGFDGRITGVSSSSTDTPLKQAGFPSQWSDFDGMASYKDWQFVAEKAFLEGSSGRAKGQPGGLQEGQP
ncbi:Type II secretory pathway, pseudopilin PulG [Pseudomonas sp. ok272]|uniref:type II secretion system protein n=1 Tax=unclassified Pseudomonas TaxID=196821 RepID=UPI0008BDC3C2|nr:MULTISPECIES: type II secretion system protein [unclassified Pseudomonas]SEN26036.1 Type II secretory pathway, pseudopilin PulG [Pseudomonas sp. ok272]SFN16889.1 Type II secretory pathway, pseudopilin PulG [Pseudomonas sp. ok602]